MQVDERRLRDFLFDAGMLPRGELERAQALAHERSETLSETLVRTGLMQADDLRRAIAHVEGVPFLILEPDHIQKHTLLLLPEAFSRAKNAVAYRSVEDGVEVAMLELADVSAVEEAIGPGRRVHARLTTAPALKRALLMYQRYLKELYGGEIGAQMQLLSAPAADPAVRMDAAVRAADALLRHALAQHAADVHIEPHIHGVQVRYRTGRELFDAMLLPESAREPLIARFAVLAGLAPAQQVPRSGRFKLHIGAVENPAESIGVTTTLVPVVHGTASAQKAVLSFARESYGRRGLSLRALGMSEANIASVRNATAHAGLVLVCGTQTAGKSTLLYTLLDELHTPAATCATVESRVSMSLPGIAQMEVNESLGLSAAACVRAQLKTNPRVLMIDVPLDEEVASLAAYAANRGTLVLLSVDAASAAEGIARLGALGVNRDVLASVFEASIGVSLVPALCERSRTSAHLGRSQLHALEDALHIKAVLDELKAEHRISSDVVWKHVELYSPQGCSECDGGYQGMVGIHEVIPVTRTLKDLIRQSAPVDELAADAERDGVLTRTDDALAKALLGLVSMEDLCVLAGLS